MKKYRILVIFSLWLAVLLAPARGVAGEPTEQLRTTIDEFVRILVDTPVSDLRAKGLPEKALALIYRRFDFAEMAKRSLGEHWMPLEASEQRDFVEAFTQRLLVAYGRTVRASGNEKIQYQREAVDKGEAIVETKVISGGSDRWDIDYRMRSVDGQWKVYDVVIDQVSVVNNYRAQFDRVIARSSVKELLQRMKQQNS